MHKASIATVLAVLLLPSVSVAGEPILLRKREHFRAPSDLANLGPAGTKATSPLAHLLRAVPHAANFQLSARASERFNNGSVTHFDVRHQGLIVLGADAVVRTNASGQPTVIVDALPDTMPDAAPGLSDADAREIARRTLAPSLPGLGMGMPSTAGELVFTMHNGVALLAWHFQPSYPLAFAFQPSVLIDAQNGTVLRMHNRVRFLNQVRAYRSNPITSPTTELLSLPGTVESTLLETPFLKSGNCIDNKRVAQINLGGGQIAPVHVCDIEQTAIRNADGDFDYEPQDGTPNAAEDPFSEAAMFYHASRAQAFFQTLQGDPQAQVVRAMPLRTVANMRFPPGLFSGNLNRAKDPNIPLEPYTNAFYTPGGGIQDILGVSGPAIVFGQGDRRDFSYDGDVVYHEYGHAVVDKTLNLGGYTVDSQGASAAPGAMNEGLADYFSSALTGDPTVGEYAGSEFSRNGNGIRSIANADVCPQTLTGEVHADSTFFSAALWDARTSLPEADRQSFDAALYKAMRTSPAMESATYEDVATLFIGVMQTDLPAGAAALRTAFAARNVLPACNRVLRSDSGIFDGPSGSGFNAWAVFSRNDLGTDIAPGLVQFARPLPAGVLRVRVDTQLEQSRGGFGASGSVAPVVLVRFGGPVVWSARGSKLTNNADVTRTPADGDISELFDVPEGATEVYVQIANKGSLDAALRNLTIATVNPPKPRPDAGTTIPSGPPAAAAPTASSGCGCNQAESERSLGWLALAFGVAAFVRRRRTPDA
jgi:hypothetical protein